MLLVHLLLMVLALAALPGGSLFRLLLAAPLLACEVYLLSVAGIRFRGGEPWETSVYALVALALMCAAWLGKQRLRATYEKLVSQWSWAIAALFAGGTAFILWLLHPSFPFPARDGTVPVHLARIFFDSGMVVQGALGQPKATFVYPPGYGIFLAAFWVPGHPLIFLGLVKIITVATLCGIPVLWGALARRLLPISGLGLFEYVAAAIVAFLLLDRTLLLATTFAGKDSQLFAALLFPALTMELLERPRSTSRWASGVFAVLGTLLVHYSVLYMIVSLFAALVVVRPAEFRGGTIPYLAGLMLCAGALFIPRYLFVSANFVSMTQLGLGDTGGAGLGAVAAAIDGLAYEFVSAKSSLLFVFEELGFSWRYKGCVLAAGVLCAGLLAMGTRQWEPGDRYNAPRLALLGMLAGSVALLLGFVGRAGINLDYARWFSYNFFALCFMGALLAVARLGRRPKETLLAAVLALGLFPGWFLRDVRAVRNSVRSGPTFSNLRSLSGALRREVPDDGSCRLLVEGAPTVLHTSLSIPELEYVYVTNRCAIENGSWFFAPEPGSRTRAGLPDESYFERASRQETRLVLTAMRARRFQKTLRCHSLDAAAVLHRSIRLYRVVKRPC